MNLFTNKINLVKIEFLLGGCTAIPIAYPEPPLYWLAVFTLFISLPRFHIKIGGLWYLLLLYLTCSFIIIINFSSYGHEDLYYPSILGTILTFQFFIFRYCLIDLDSYVNGFLFVIKIYTIATIILFFILKPYCNGFDFFINSNMRLWGKGYLPEWPNVFSCFLVIGSYLYFRQEHFKWAFFSFIASLLTTSRIPLLGAVILLLFYYLSNITLKKTVLILSLVSLCVVIVLFLIPHDVLDRYITHRLLKFSDRSLIYSNLLETFYKSPLGIGNIPFSNLNDLYVSYHSSYLKALIRYGVLGLILFLLVIYPRRLFINLRMKENAPIFFILCVALFQDILFHIHLIMIYSVLLALREKQLDKILNNESNVYYKNAI